VLIIWSSEVLRYIVLVCYAVEIFKYYCRRNVYFYWQHLLEPLETYALLIYTDIDICYILFCVLFKIIQVSVCDPPLPHSFYIIFEYLFCISQPTSSSCLQLRYRQFWGPSSSTWWVAAIYISRYCENTSVLLSLLFVCPWNICTCMVFY